MEAVIGLLGVLVGGVLTGLVAVWQDNRRERVRVRIGARLLLDRFDTAIRTVETMKDWEGAFTGPEDFQAPEWEEYRVSFAAALDHDEFRAIALGVKQLRYDHDVVARSMNNEGIERWIPGGIRGYRVPEAILSELAADDLSVFPLRLLRKLSRNGTVSRLDRAQRAKDEHAAQDQEHIDVAQRRATEAWLATSAHKPKSDAS